MQTIAIAFFSTIGLLLLTSKISKRIKNFLLGIILLLSIKSNATHIVGGELNYKYLGNNQYEIYLIVYRDCYNGIPQLDNPAYVFIYDAFNNLETSIAISLDSSTIIPSTVNSPCFVPPVNICYERSYYHTQTVTLPPSPSGYQLAYQRCCRNNTILNLVQPGATGATFYAFIPGTSTFSQNDNPVFDSLPPPFICLGVPFVFDHSATDADLDSVAYELCNPYNGADTLNPVPTPINLPDPPPYVPVVFNPPFSIGNIVSASPPFVIDPITGIITGTPNLQGQYVVAVCAKEFRNGIYLSSTRRDFQLNVVPCPTLVVAAIQNPVFLCGSTTVSFQNFSVNASAYDWDFGVTTSLADTSHALFPTFTYPDTGTYIIRMVAHSNVNGGCTDTTTGVVNIYPDYFPSFTYTKELCTNRVSFSDTSNLDSGPTVTWNWNFGDGTNSNQHNPIHLFAQSGLQTITLTGTSSKGCTKTITQQITLPPLLAATLSATDPVNCAGDCNGSAIVTAQNGTAPYTYQWNDPLLQTTNISDSLCKGTYQVIVTDSNACADTLNVIINEPLPLTLQLSSTLAYCHGACIGSAVANAGGGNGGYNYQWNDPQTQTTAQATQLCPGTYAVIITDSRNCMITDSIAVLYSDTVPYVKASTDKDTLYQGQTAQLNAQPTANYTFNWTPIASLNAYTISTPVAAPTITTTYFVVVTDTNGCTNIDSVRIVVLDVTCKEPEIFIPNAFTPNNDQQNDVLLVRGNTMEKVFMAVYDRWGEKVFETNNQKQGWNGTYKGEKVTPGVYVYYLQATCFDKQEFFKKGNVTLLK